MTVTFSHNETQEITDLLMGRKVVNVDKDIATLDDGRKLRFVGNDGGCACSAGCYDLTDLNTVDNIITSVEFYDSPAADGEDGEGVYKIFVYADNARINLASFEGTDGNGYYGTGYAITVMDV